MDERGGDGCVIYKINNFKNLTNHIFHDNLRLILGKTLDPRLLGKISLTGVFFVLRIKGKGERKMVTISKFSFDNPRFINLLRRESSIPEEVESTVKKVLSEVKERGDGALHTYMEEYDQVDIKKTGLFVSEEEFKNAREKVSEEFKESVKRACDNLFRFHKRQMPSGYRETYEDGSILERRYTPIHRVAVTVPGNMAPLVSTLCMNLVPAIVAGVPEIYILTKPCTDGTIDEHLLYAADYLNVKNYYKISGSQGLAAVAYGTETVKKVDAIVGPGNNYTQMAKKLLFGQVKIDFLAGSSEIAIIADERANPAFIAADMISQAEHGTGYEASTAFCLSERQAEEIKREIFHLCNEHNLVAATQKSFENYGDIFIVDSIEEAVNAVNQMAPEHVELMLENEEEALHALTNAGAVFVGEYSTEPVGDYFCGSNHILPTCGTARFSSGMSVQEFMRGYSVIHYPEAALKTNADSIIKLAESEHMRGHALAVKIRRGM